MFIYAVMIIFILQFVASYVLTIEAVKPEAADPVVAVFYFVAATLIGFSSIHFLCEMKRNFGTGTFQEAKQNVLIIVITILVGFVYTIIVMSIYGASIL
jgi:hypothetical protein